jgi:ADP-heptose:LPS heptosyltransferase
MFEQRRQVLAAAGFSLEAARFDLRVPEEARQWADATIAAQSVHLSISASTPVKEWPLENWIDLVQMLLEKRPSVQIVATAGSNPREQERLRKLAAAGSGERLQCIEGVNIARLAAVLQRCRLHIGSDSGALHLAVAVGVPTLTVFREYSCLAEWMPVGSQHRHLVAACRCIDENRTDCLAAGRSACLAAITPAQVCGQACQQLQ